MIIDNRSPWRSTTGSSSLLPARGILECLRNTTDTSSSVLNICGSSTLAVRALQSEARIALFVLSLSFVLAFESYLARMADGCMTANEIEFLSEEEEVKIIPKFAMGVLRMIGVSWRPFRVRECAQRQCG